MTSELSAVRVVAERAYKAAQEAKQMAPSSVHENDAPSGAITAHIAKLESQIAPQSTSPQAVVVQAQNQTLIKQNIEAERKRQARMNLWKVWGPITVGFFAVLRSEVVKFLTGH